MAAGAATIYPSYDGAIQYDGMDYVRNDAGVWANCGLDTFVGMASHGFFQFEDFSAELITADSIDHITFYFLPMDDIACNLSFYQLASDAEAQSDMELYMDCADGAFDEFIWFAESDWCTQEPTNGVTYFEAMDRLFFGISVVMCDDQTGIDIYTVEAGGTAYDPYLYIEYTYTAALPKCWGQIVN